MFNSFTELAPPRLSSNHHRPADIRMAAKAAELQAAASSSPKPHQQANRAKAKSTKSRDRAVDKAVEAWLP